MASSFFASYKPQVLSRQEGFHLPSPAPSNNPPSPPSTNSTPGSTSNNNPSNGGFDPHNLFLPPFLSVPDSFRKFPGQADSSMDFGDELASLIGSPPSQERSTQSPPAQSNGNGNGNGGYDDYRPHTHNIFDISAPTTHHHHNQYGASAFSLPPASSLHSHHHSQSGSQQQGTHPSSLASHPIHEFSTHAHFNSTLPAIGSSMRYEPPPTPSTFASTPGGEASSFPTHLSFNLNNSTNGADYRMPRQTPSPVSANPNSLSRSRSRSRAPHQPPTPSSVNPPSTNGGPTRRTRAKRNSVSSVSPPPLHRHTQPLVIPGAGVGVGRGPVSPLSLHTGGWFMPGQAQGQNGQNGTQGSEFSLPTPESVHGGFSAFTGSVPLGVSPKEVSLPPLSAGGLNGMNVGSMGLGMGGVGGKGESPPGDMAVKQAILANEKRRRRRESHNAVERRRRDNINEKISELATLIPECLLDPNASITMPPLTSPSEELLFGTPTNGAEGGKGSVKDGSAEPEEGGSPGAQGQAGPDGAVKANKGMILRKSVDYIRYLQQLVSAQATRNRELEAQLASFRSSSMPSSSPATASSVSSSNLAQQQDTEDLSTLVLHTELAPALPSPPSVKRFGGFELESVEEMDQDERLTPEGEEDGEMGDGDVDMEGAGGEGEEERGRRGRDGRVPGKTAAQQQGVKVEGGE